MSEKKPIIWMNVTTSVNWRRPPVGIVRVERSLCFELKSLYGESFKQCIWRDGHFVEFCPTVEVASENKNFINHAHQTESIKAELPSIYLKLPRRKALVAIAQGFLSLMPLKLQPYVNRLLYSLRPVVSRALSKEWVSSLFRVSHQNTSEKLVQVDSQVIDSNKASEIFSPKDVLISVGLDWDYSYYKEFYWLRKKHGIKIVSCCYDLIPVMYPQYCVNDVAGIFTSYFLEVADGSDVVLCISKQSENDLNQLLELTGGARTLTHVFPLGDNVPESDNEAISEQVKLACSKEFILFVSTIERRKNHEVLYRAYHLLCKQGKKAVLPKLVFVGMQGWGVNELLKDIELDPLVRDMIISLSHVNDSELRKLYEMSLFCVFPSLYEGWGLPVGEALALGKAVICSNRGSLPEVGGDLVQYVDPWKPQDWADEILRMSTDENWRKLWEKRVQNNYTTRSWTAAAKSIEKCLGSLS